jgi:hypothetical protein
MTTIHAITSSDPTPAELVQAGKDAFAAGVSITGSPYPDESEQNYIWARGHMDAQRIAGGYPPSAQTLEETIEEFRWLKVSEDIGNAFRALMDRASAEGVSLRDEAFQWLCGGFESRADFLYEAELAADDYFPEEDGGEGKDE